MGSDDGLSKASRPYYELQSAKYNNLVPHPILSFNPPIKACKCILHNHVTEVFKDWTASESSVILKNKICLVPPVIDSYGYLALQWVSISI